MRIIAGIAKGRRIEVPDRVARPTSDRAREALFSSLESLRGPWDGARVLDLYAGSGALGLEALSRGAAHALLVDSSPKAVQVLRRNVSAVGLPGATIVADDVGRLLARPVEGGAYDVVLADPPYATGNDDVEKVLSLLVRWLAPDGLVVVERSKRTAALSWPAGIEAVRERSYGEAVLWYGRAP